MNRKKEMEIAKQHCNEGQCYVKAEDRELLVCGDTIAIIRVAERIITRVGDITGSGFESCWLSVREIHNLSEDSTTLHRGVAMPRESDELKKQIETLQGINNDLAEKLAEAENLADRFKAKHQKEIAEKDKQIKELSKEAVNLEHRMKEMEEGFGGDSKWEL